MSMNEVLMVNNHDELAGLKPFESSSEVAKNTSTVVVTIGLERSPFPDRIEVFRVAGLQDDDFFSVLRQATDTAEEVGLSFFDIASNDQKQISGLSALLGCLSVMEWMSGVTFVTYLGKGDTDLEIIGGLNVPHWSEDTLKMASQELREPEVKPLEATLELGEETVDDAE